MTITSLAAGLITALALAATPAGAAGKDKADASAAPASGTARPKGKAEPALVDINSATREQLMTLPGIGDAEVGRIIAARPYLTKAHLVTRGVITEAVFDQMRKRVIARQAAAAPARKASAAAKGK